jgi:hypothetical protein
VLAGDAVPATAIKDLLLGHVFGPGA